MFLSRGLHIKAKSTSIIKLLSFRYLSTTNIDKGASCEYRNGFVVVTLPLPSRNEDCEFTLRPISNQVKDLVNNVYDEDKGIDRIAVHSMNGKKISNSTPIEILMQQDFKMTINDDIYDIIPPKVENISVGVQDQLSSTKNLISQLYTDVNVQEYKENREKAIQTYLENLQNELSPLEQQKALIDENAAKRTNFLVWAGLGFMGLQFGFLARLTWWEYSWDIMEPVTYFVTYFSSMVFYTYFVLTRQDANYPEVRNRSHLLSFYRESDKNKFDVANYNAKKDLAAKLEHELKLLKSPPVFLDLTKSVDTSK